MPCHPTPDLAVDHGRIDDLAAVLHHDVAGDLHQAGVEVDLHEADVGGARPPAGPAVEDLADPDGLVTLGGAPGATRRRLVRPPTVAAGPAGGGGHVGQGDGDGGRAGHVDAPVFDDDVGRRR